MRSWLLVPLSAFVLATQVEGARPMSEKELAEFLGPVSPRVITWTKSVGADFDAYIGRAQPPLSGTVNIYIGGWPHFSPNRSGSAIVGRLGPFPVTWHRKTASDGTTTQEAAIKLYDAWKVDIWVEAKRQSDI